jgi:hypothetical protein
MASGAIGMPVGLLACQWAHWQILPTGHNILKHLHSVSVYVCRAKNRPNQCRLGCRIVKISFSNNTISALSG